MERISNAHTSGDFIYDDKSHLKEKMDRFIEAGPDSLHIVFDFDRTLTVSREDEDITTWHILKNHLPKEGQDQYQELFEENRIHEINGTMDDVRAVMWWSSILDLFVKYKVDLDEVENDFLSKASIRPEAKELFDLCSQAGIPTVIMSAGIKDLIDIWARTYNINPTIVLSTSLQLSKEGIAEGWDKDSLVHILNKKEIDHPELTRIRLERPLSIIIGDSLNDADMATGTDDVIRIRLYDPRDDEKTELDTMRAKTFEQFDTVIESGTLLAVRQFVQRVINKTV
jgi:HAD superfamily phosphoserine phosphatase-like hydrolase